MRNLNLLFVAGNWGPDGGRPSKYMDQLAEHLAKKVTGHVDVHNGGTIEELKEILETRAKQNEVVFWSPNIPNELKNGILTPKDYNPACTLINFKRNDHGRLSYDDLKSLMIAQKADITCEVFKDDTGRYQMRIFDIQDCLISHFTPNTGKSMTDLVSRIYILRSLSYSRLSSSGESHPILNPNFEEIANAYAKFGEFLKKQIKNNFIRRHLGEIAFRGFMDSLTPSNDTVVVNARHVKLDMIHEKSAYVTTRLLSNRVNYYGETRPCFNSSTYLRVLSHLPKVRYIFFSDLYCNDAKYTEKVLPSQCIEQVAEILFVIRSYCYETNFAINLLGCGSMIFLSSLDKLDEYLSKLQRRGQPEYVVPEYETIECDDGISFFTNTLKDREIKNDELLEILFDDGSVSVYKANIKEYTDEEGRPHKEAFIRMSVKGIKTEVNLIGMKARRV